MGSGKAFGPILYMIQMRFLTREGAVMSCPPSPPNLTHIGIIITYLDFDAGAKVQNWRVLIDTESWPDPACEVRNMFTHFCRDVYQFSSIIASNRCHHETSRFGTIIGTSGSSERKFQRSEVVPEAKAF
jgi:hypothetical protein